MTPPLTRPPSWEVPAVVLGVVAVAAALPLARRDDGLGTAAIVVVNAAAIGLAALLIQGAVRTPTQRLIARGLLGVLIQAALVGTLLLVPAGLLPGGTWRWRRAWIFLGGYAASMAALVIALGMAAPASLEVRLRRVPAETRPRADRVVTALLYVTLLGWIAALPADVFAWRLLPGPGTVVSAMGGLLALLGLAVVGLTMAQNAFAAPVVADQTDRGQTVVDTGLYAVVRHPLYLGIIPYLVGTALWLESTAGAVAAILPVLVLVARIAVEERMLRATLPGYVEYTRRVRYRLVPYVW